jgi:hypothetical protein
MTKNLKNFEAARKCIVALKAQVDAEFKADPRFKRGAARGANLLRILDIMQERYEVVHGRKVPAKVQAKKAGAKKTTAKKAAAKKPAKKAAKKASNVVELHPKKEAAAQASKRGDVKRSPKHAAGIRAGVRKASR